MDGPASLLARECAQVSKLLGTLTDRDWTRVTRLAPWRVLELVAHLHQDLDAVEAATQSPGDGPIDCDAVTYWQSYDRSEDAALTTAGAEAAVAALETGEAVRAAFERSAARAVQVLRDEPPTTAVRTWGPVMVLEQFALTRVVEVVVHGLDLADALDQAPVASAPGLRVVEQILGALLGESLPDEIVADRIAWIEKATGRAALSERDRAVLGPLAQRIPLIA